MGIGPLELSGAISRVQDFATIKQNEDNRGLVEQTAITQNVRKEAENKTTTVNRDEASERENNKFDAREKGKNEYHGNGGSERKDQKPKGDGRVVFKGQTSGFDVRI